MKLPSAASTAAAILRNISGCKASLPDPGLDSPLSPFQPQLDHSPSETAGK